ncbi:MAG: FtsX-like permease family protein [Bacteriovoracaceae bacterium]
MGSAFSFFKIIIQGKASGRFLVAAVLSFSFSIAVILSTVGLMDGFVSALKTSLKGSSGDFHITSNRGFFLKEDVLPALEDFPSASIMQVESFAVSNGLNKGVLVKGVEKDEFKKISSLNLEKLESGVVIGKELAKALDLSPGDELTLTFASDQTRDQGGAVLKKYKVDSVVSHGIYEKDLRFVYTDRLNLTRGFGYKKGAVNKILALQNPSLGFEASQAALKRKLGNKFEIEPYWSEYKTLLRAVEVEKTSISFILQIIVVVAIFNVIAFIIFISEKKSQEFFLLRAFGASMKKITSFWRGLLLFIWFASALLSLGLTWLFNLLLTSLPVFELPGDIYVLSKLRLELGWEDFALVFSLALGWILIIGAATMWRMKKRTVLAGLREEFK